MKLPKGFGNMGGILKQAEEAMAKAQNMEQELSMEVIEVERAGVTARFNGVAELLSLKIDPAIVDSADLTGLEDAVLLAMREGLSKAGELRKTKLAEITGGLPLPPGMGL
jgi:DNA-binding YbaB/EbfC family protein